MIEIAMTRRLRCPAGDLHLQVEQSLGDGEFIALFGPSGAGKTSILRMLAGLARPDSGRIVVDGAVWFDAAQRIDLAPQARSVGFVAQDYALFPNLSVRENIGYAVPRGERAWVDELLALMQLTALQDRLPRLLSGGQQQRVALARAVARKPVLLLLDEPLAALDLQLRLQLQADLAFLQQRMRMKTIMVSHDLGEVFRLAHRVWRLEGGRIAQAGSPATVFLEQRLAGRLTLRAQVLSLRREEVVTIVTLLVGQDIVDVVAADDEAAVLQPGDMVVLSAKTFGALRFDGAPRMPRMPLP